jgi:hypothetical protein
VAERRRLLEDSERKEREKQGEGENAREARDRPYNLFAELFKDTTFFYDEHERRRLQDAANASVELIQGPRSSAVAAGVAPALHSLRRYEGYRKLAEGGDRTFKFTEVCAWEPED